MNATQGREQEHSFGGSPRSRCAAAGGGQPLTLMPVMTIMVNVPAPKNKRGKVNRMTTPRVVGIVPAAGRGSRFAEADPTAPPKMLAPVDDVPMVRRTVQSLVNGGVAHCVVVVTSRGAAAIAQALHGLPVSLIVNPDPARGMFSSVQCGVSATDPADVCVLLPGDMPFVQASTIATLIAAARGGAHTVTPSLDGHRGHPVVCSTTLRASIVAAAPDFRLDHLMDRVTVVPLDVSDSGVRRDVDRPRVPSE
jgi:molybdenum cofactor cytidylyltransferase